MPDAIKFQSYKIGAVVKAVVEAVVEAVRLTVSVASLERLLCV